MFASDFGFSLLIFFFCHMARPFLIEIPSLDVNARHFNSPYGESQKGARGFFLIYKGERFHLYRAGEFREESHLDI